MAPSAERVCRRPEKRKSSRPIENGQKTLTKAKGKEPSQFTPTSSPESASLQIDPTGQIVVTLHSQSLWGNSPETVVSQVVAEEFDVDPASVVVTYADSQHALPGTGPGGSR